MKPVSAQTVSAVMDDALSLHRAGQFDAAAMLYARILAVYPQHADALHMAGTLAQHRGELDLALLQIGTALTLAPSSDRHVSMGMLQHARGETDSALVNLQQALALNPGNAIAHNNLGTILQGQGKIAAAMESYINALTNQPDYASAYNNLGSAAHDLGNVKEAAECYRQALALDPNHAMAHNNYGNALRNLGHATEALAYFERSIALQPTAMAHTNYGNAFRDLDRLDEAIAHFDAAIVLDPGYAMAHNNLGNALRDRGEPQRAIACFQQALEYAPALAEIFSNRLLTMQTMPEITPQALFAEHRRYAERYEKPLLAQQTAYTNDPDPARRLKIGFVSGDFREHALLYFFEPVLAGLDRKQFDVFCYYNHYTDDAASQRIAALADHWLPCRAWSDEVMAARIRADQIDILVDLSGHTAHNRLLVFARKPAPVQLTWIGYQSTTGLTSMDYRLTDASLDPPGLTEEFHSETVLRIPSSAPFRPSVLRPEVNRLPALNAPHFTFACLNQLAKISDQAISLWVQILTALPHSRMMLANVNDDATRHRLLERFAHHGITPERLVLQPRMRLADYLALHLQIDLCLDSFPYNGGTTTFHALSMGVPVLALAGVTPIARAGVAIVAGLGLQDFIATSAEEYVAKAIMTAQDLAALDRLRQLLPHQFAAQDDKQETALVNNVEAVLHQIWNTWCKQVAI